MTKKPLKYTNFYPGSKRQENETCAAINIMRKGADNNTHFPGYWHYMQCDTELIWMQCQTSIHKSKQLFNHTCARITALGEGELNLLNMFLCLESGKENFP